MRKTRIYLFCIMACLLSLTACGKKQEQTVEEETFAFIEEVVEEEKDDFDRTGLTWDNTQWVNPVTMDSQKRLYIEKYQKYQWVYAEKEMALTTLCGSTFYKLEEMKEEEEEYGYIIEGYDVEKNVGSKIILKNDVLFEGNENSYLEGFCVKSENEIILLAETVDEVQMTGLEAIHIDKEGTILKRVNLYDAFVESEVCPVTELGYWKTIGMGIGDLDDSHYFLILPT